MSAAAARAARARVADLGDELRRTLADVLPDGCDRCALIDFPRHRNSGDSAIWLGERRLLARLGVEVVATAERQTYSRERIAATGEGTPILLHGGGNFGDLYPGHQRLREQVLADFPDRPVVQLAQSLWFESETALRRAAEVIGRCRDLVLLVRDERSYALASRAFDATVRYCPDFAFALGPLERSRPPRHDAVRLARIDKEAPPGSPAGGLPTFDWLADPPTPGGRRRLWAWRRLLTATAGGGRLGRRGLAPASAVLRVFDAYAEDNLRRAVAALSGGRVVVTDRLHGHILCVMLGIPHVLLDDRNGKVSAFHERWTSGLELARLVRDEGEVPDVVAELLAAADPP